MYTWSLYSCIHCLLWWFTTPRRIMFYTTLLNIYILWQVGCAFCIDTYEQVYRIFSVRRLVGRSKSLLKSSETHDREGGVMEDKDEICRNPKQWLTGICWAPTSNTKMYIRSTPWDLHQYHMDSPSAHFQFSANIVKDINPGTAPLGLAFLMRYIWDLRVPTLQRLCSSRIQQCALPVPDISVNSLLV